MMHMTLTQTFGAISTGAAAWLMVRAGASQGLVKIRAPEKCASCGRRRLARRCPCTTVD
jgi:hypothetical protein